MAASTGCFVCVTFECDYPLHCVQYNSLVGVVRLSLDQMRFDHVKRVGYQKSPFHRTVIGI
jgi:hypothetical protein